MKTEYGESLSPKGNMIFFRVYNNERQSWVSMKVGRNLNEKVYAIFIFQPLNKFTSKLLITFPFMLYMSQQRFASNAESKNNLQFHATN